MHICATESEGKCRYAGKCCDIAWAGKVIASIGDWLAPPDKHQVAALEQGDADWICPEPTVEKEIKAKVCKMQVRLTVHDDMFGTATLLVQGLLTELGPAGKRLYRCSTLLMARQAKPDQQ